MLLATSLFYVRSAIASTGLCWTLPLLSPVSVLAVIFFGALPLLVEQQKGHSTCILVLAYASAIPVGLFLQFKQKNFKNHLESEVKLGTLICYKTLGICICSIHTYIYVPLLKYDGGCISGCILL